jgi:hypothetical protein
VKTPILGSTYVARSVNAADARMVNLFPEIVPEAGKEPAFLQRAPGLRLLATLGDGPIRGQWQMGAYGYAVSGNLFYKIDQNWTATAVGSVVGSGPVSMADNGTQIFIACGGPSYIYDASANTIQQITDADFPGAVTVAYLDGYFVFNPPDSQQIWITSLLDGTSIDALDFASAEGAPDNLVSLIVDHREVWLFGTNSVEVWYDAGTPDFPLQRIQGAFNEIGCAAPYSVAKLDNGLFWLGKDARGQGIVYRANGYTGQRVSTHAVEWHIQQYGNLSDAVGYTYQQDGHSFYVLSFPSANTTWVYDVATSAWHERASWANGEFGRHWGVNQMAFSNEISVGDYRNGNLYAFDLDVYADNGQVQRWLRSWRALPTGQNNLKRTAHHSLQLDAQTGHPLSFVEQFFAVQDLAAENDVLLLTEDAEYILVETKSFVSLEPQFMLRWSDDGGHTWSNEHWSNGGAIGEYFRRVLWRRLGMTLELRDRVYEVSGSDPIKIAIMGAELSLSPTNA